MNPSPGLCATKPVITGTSSDPKVLTIIIAIKANPVSMPYKICYIFSGDKPNIYWRFLLISALTSRIMEPGRQVILVTDKITRAALQQEFEVAENLGVFDQIIPVMVEDNSAVARSRFLKTSLRHYVKGDFIFLDADTILAGPLDLPDDCADIRAVEDLNTAKVRLGSSVIAKCEELGWSLPVSPFFNSGVLFVRDTPGSHQLFAKWHELWREQRHLVGSHKDQLPLAEALSRAQCSRSILPYQYNAQVMYRPQLAANAKIIHVFANHPQWAPRIRTVWDDLWRTGEINKESVAHRLSQPFFTSSFSSKWILASINNETPDKQIPFGDWRRLWLAGRFRESLIALLKRSLKQALSLIA